MAFTVYFELVNLAKENFLVERLRRLRAGGLAKERRPACAPSSSSPSMDSAAD
jgi:hypothetical protein